MYPRVLHLVWKTKQELRATADGTMTTRVSIVENDQLVREILTDWLRGAEGFEFVSAFGNAEDSLAQLPGEKPDVVLMDIKLPGVDVVECVRQLKPQLFATQFVIHTVFEDSNLIFDALKAGAIGYLLKRSNRDELFTALKYFHAGGALMTSYFARRVVRCFPNPPASVETDYNLSPRERNILEMFIRGFFDEEISPALNVTVRTMDTYIRRIYDKLHVRSGTQTVAKHINCPLPNNRAAHPR